MILFEDFGADDVARHQVRRELDAAEIERERLTERTHEQGLTETGHAFEQAVAAGEQADQKLLDHVALTDDDLSDRFAQRAEFAELMLDGLFGDGVVHWLIFLSIAVFGCVFFLVIPACSWRALNSRKAGHLMPF